ncbi:MAG: ATP-dependent DNA helicase UvrD/PcrA [Ignavibacteriae bacterium]|nr:MAG: ATP-dependent DNA helicase UvrD/PcrA [Ignavibacteriota bacterium]
MSFLKDLNEVQQQAVKYVNGPLMIVAGAGSGKTRVLTYRTAYLIQIGVPAYQLIVLTFTNKAADEMKNRIIKLVGDKSQNVWMGTFHSMFARLLRNEAEKLGYTSNFTIYDTDDSNDLIKSILNKFGKSIQSFKPAAIRAKISSWKNRLVTPEQSARNIKSTFDEISVDVYREYTKRLKESNAMDFDDLLIKPIELFKTFPSVLDKYQERFKFILVDEYQDTNKAQYEMIKLLAGKYRNVCVVGDDAQSIYRFRGADIQNILSFEKDFPDCKIFRLEQNYRSTKLILSAADQVIQNNKHRIDKKLWTENPVGEPITLLTCENEMDEGEQIAQKIKHSIKKYKIDFKDIAILYRTNAQSRSLEDALRRNSIPYVIVGGVEFYKRKEIKDVLAYLKLIVNPKDDISFKRIVNYPSRGIGDVTLKNLEKIASKYNTSLFEAIDLLEQVIDFSDKSAERLRNFKNLITKYIQIKSVLKPSELSRNLVEEIGILKEFKEESTPESIARWENVQELLSAIMEYCSTNEDASLESFLQEVSLVADIDKWDSTHNAVTLMTLHSAKGLEFKVVFIAGLEEGLFPINQSLMDEAELEEERRLFYVGITRTIKKLFLSYALKRYYMGDLIYPQLSRFFYEIKSNLIESEEYSISRKVKNKTFTNHEFKVSKSKFYEYENESQIPSYLDIGAYVLHNYFGKGRVIEVSGNGENTRVVVDFENVGRKNLMLKYANLKVL